MRGALTLTLIVILSLTPIFTLVLTLTTSLTSNPSIIYYFYPYTDIDPDLLLTFNLTSTLTFNLSRGYNDSYLDVNLKFDLDCNGLNFYRHLNPDLNPNGNSTSSLSFAIILIPIFILSSILGLSLSSILSLNPYMNQEVNLYFEIYNCRNLVRQ